MKHPKIFQSREEWIDSVLEVDGEKDDLYRNIESKDYPDSGFSLTGFIHPKDAKLIAAAPELLEALIVCRAQIGNIKVLHNVSYPNSERAYERARIAIKNATV